LRKLPSLGYAIYVNPYQLNGAQKMMQKQGNETVTPRIGLSYMSSPPVRILRWHKDKRSITQYVMVEEARHDKGDNATSSPKSSMFSRLQPSTRHQ